MQHSTHTSPTRSATASLLACVLVLAHTPDRRLIGDEGADRRTVRVQDRTTSTAWVNQNSEHRAVIILFNFCVRLRIHNADICEDPNG